MNRILLHTVRQGRYAVIDPDRINYIHCSYNNCMIHMIDKGQISVFSSLIRLHEKFPNLMRPHASYLVNINHVRGINHLSGGVSVEMKFSNDEKIDFAKGKKFYSPFFRILSSSSGSGDEKGE